MMLHTCDVSNFFALMNDSLPLLPSVSCVLKLLLLSGICVMGGAAHGQSTSLAVTTAADTVNATDSLTSLREALAYAATLTGPQTITFGNGSTVSGGTDFTDATADTIRLNGTELDVANDLTIQGPGMNLLQVDGASASRVFFVSGGTTIFNDLSIVNGSTVGLAGSGISTASPLTVNRCRLSGNTGNNNGGAIRSVSSLTVNECVFHLNSAFTGAGISSNGVLAVSGSTFSGNTSNSGGAAIDTSGPTVVNQSTFSGNSSSNGAVIHGYDDNLAVLNCTLTKNAPGADATNGITLETFRRNPILTMGNTIFDRSSISQLVVGGSGSVTITSLGNNLTTDATAGFFTGPGDRFNRNPQLGPLADNGGPTQTHALLVGSPAIDRGKNSLVPSGTTTDQRGTGFPRLRRTVDIGALELQAEIRSLVVTTTNDGFSNSDDLTSLREAVAYAATLTGPQTITFGNGSAVSGGTNFTDNIADIIALDGTRLDLLSNLTIRGRSATLLGISGNLASTIFSVGASTVATLESLSVVNGGFAAAGIDNEGTLTLAGCSFLGNKAGALSNTGTVTITGCAFTNNSSTASGGAIFNTGSLAMTSCTFTNNTASSASGGAISNNGPITVTLCTFTSNSSRLLGGAIDSGVPFTVTACLFEGNSAFDDAALGGAIYCGGALTVTRCTFFENLSRNKGGAISSLSGNLKVEQSTFSGNSASNEGAALHLLDGGLTLENCTFKGHAASGISLEERIVNTTLTMGNTIFAQTSIVPVSGISQNGNNGIVTITSLGHNLTTDTTAGVFTGAGDLINTDPQLGPLVNNSGPTITHALLVGSPAVNAGSNALISAGTTTDQRGAGFTRVRQGTVDIGAVEGFPEPSSLIVTTVIDVLANGDDLTSLRDALAYAATLTGPQTITFGNGTAFTGGTDFTDATADTITLNGTELVVTSSMTIQGPGRDLLKLDGDLRSRVLNMTSTIVAVTVNDLSVLNGTTVGGAGAGIFSLSPITLNRCFFSGNTTNNNGGGIFSGNRLVANECTFSGNYAVNGAGINGPNLVTVRNCTFSGNTVLATGAGIYCQSNATVSESTFSDNTSGGEGSAIRVVNGNLAVRNCTLSRNSTSSGAGSGISMLAVGETISGEIGNTILDRSAVFNSVINSGSNIGSVTFTSLGNNLTTATTAGIFTGPADRFDTDPLLGPLANNGGPTLTHALLLGSPAIDAGNNALVPSTTTTEQRGMGFPRFFGGRVDIGAVEGFAYEPAITAATTTEDTATTSGLVISANLSDDGETTAYFISNIAGGRLYRADTTEVTASNNGLTLASGLAGLVFQPAANANDGNTTSFGFSVQAATGSTPMAIGNPVPVVIAVAALNDAPLANSQTLTTDEDTATAITLTGSDADGNALTYTITTPPTAAMGILTGTAPNLTFTPTVDFNGTASFAFNVNDGTADSTPAQVTINVTPENDAPIATAQSVTAAEDTAQAITLAATDADGDALTYTIVTSPANGTLTGTAPNLTFTPALNFSGSTSVTFLVNDGTVNSAAAMVSIIVTASNDAPVALAQNLTTPEDTSKSITLTGTDTEGDPLTYIIVSGPSNGTLTGTAPNLTFNPTLNFNGTASFTFKANDGLADSNIATISIAVTAVNDAPTAIAQSAGTTRNTDLALTLSSTDPENSPLTFTVVTAPTNGTLTGTAPNLTYRPNSNYVGADSLTFRVNDGTADSALATVNVTVSFSNVAPVAIAQSVSTNEDTTKSITLTGTDADPDTLTFTIVNPPTNGTLTGTIPNLTYTPALNFSGSDSFTFKVNDGTVDSPASTVSITVTPQNDPPVATLAFPDTLQIRPGLRTSIGLSAYFSDSEDGTTLTYRVLSTTGGAFFTPQIVGSQLHLDGITPGEGSITVEAQDSAMATVSSVARIRVKYVPEVSTAIPDQRTIIGQSPVVIDLPAHFLDRDIDALTFSLVSNSAPTRVAATVSGNSLTLRGLTANTATIVVQATDTDGNSVTDSLNVVSGTEFPTVSLASAQTGDRQTGLFSQTVQVENTTGLTIPGFRLTVSSLGAGNSLYNALVPGGNYVEYRTSMAPAATATLTLVYSVPSRVTNFTPTFTVSALGATTTVSGDGSGLAVVRVVALANRDLLIEFLATAGRYYEIEYSSDLTNWKKALSPIRAGANRVLWIDRGEPTTESHPSTVSSRYYRVHDITRSTR